MSSWESRLRAGGVVVAGREEEADAIRAAASRSYEGGGVALVLVTGGRSAGKSRLLEAIADEARRAGALVLAGRAEAPRRMQGFGVLIEVLRASIGAPVGGDRAAARAALAAWCAQIAPSLDEDAVSHLGYLLGVADPAEPAIDATGGDPRLIRDATWAAVTRFVERVASARPVLIAVDDLEWADDASVDLLAYWTRRAARLRLAIMVTAPPDIVARRPGLASGELQPVRVELRPAIAGAAALPGDAAAPRLEELPPPDRRAIALGSLLGSSFWGGALEAMGVTGAEALLDGLSRRSVVVPSRASRFEGERQWELAQRAWGDAAREALAPEEAAAAHLAAGLWLRARGEDAAVVGEHLARGGAGEEAATVIEAAAESAERAGALAAAQGLAFRAAALGEAGAARTRRRLLGIRQGLTHTVARDELRAEVEALLAEAADDPLGRAARAAGGGALFLLGETGEAHIDRLVDVTRRAAAEGEPQTAAWALRHASFALSLTARQAEAEALVREITGRLTSLDPEVETAIAHARGILLMNGGRVVEAVETLGLAFDLACVVNQRSVAVEHGADYAYGLLVAGDLDACFDVLEHAFDLAEETGSGLDQILQNVIEHAAWGGPHARMDTPLVRRAFARAHAVSDQDRRRYSLSMRTMLQAFSADWPRDARALPPAEILARHDTLRVAIVDAGFGECCAVADCAAARALSLLGEHGRALASAESGREAAAKMDLDIYAISAAFAAHEAARGLGREGRAREALEEAAELLRKAMSRRSGSRYASLLLTRFVVHRRILAACAEHGIAAPELID